VTSLKARFVCNLLHLHPHVLNTPSRNTRLFQCKKHGFDLSPRELVAAITSDIFANGPRPEMVAAIMKLRQLGFLVGGISKLFFGE